MHTKMVEKYCGAKLVQMSQNEILSMVEDEVDTFLELFAERGEEKEDAVIQDKFMIG